MTSLLAVEAGCARCPLGRAKEDHHSRSVVEATCRRSVDLVLPADTEAPETLVNTLRNWLDVSSVFALLGKNFMAVSRWSDESASERRATLGNFTRPDSMFVTIQYVSNDLFHWFLTHGRAVDF